MSEEQGGGTNMIKDTLEAATGLVKAVPLYQDAIQPVAKQLGKSLETVGKAINAAFLPIEGLVWGAENIQVFLKTKLTSKLKDVPPEDIITPKPNVAGPAIEALRYAGHEQSLSEMYANLLAAAMDGNIAEGAHPAFVEIIKQLTSDEAKLMAYLLGPGPFSLVTVRAEYEDEARGGVDVAINLSLLGDKAELQFRELTPTYLDNLGRLGLIEIPENFRYIDDAAYEELENSQAIADHRLFIEQTHKRVLRMKRSGVKLTNLGSQFGKICIVGHASAS